MLWRRSPQYEGMPLEQYLQTEEGRRSVEASNRYAEMTNRMRAGQLPRQLPAPVGNPAPAARPLPSLPANWRGTRDQLAAQGFGLDIQGRPQYMPKQPPANGSKSSKYGMFNMDGTPATDQMNAIARHRAAQESAGVAQFQDVSDRAAHEQAKRQHERAMMDMERRAAEWQLGQVMNPQDQASQQPDLRKLIEEQRRQMDQDDQMRKVAEMLANEQRGRDVLASGQEWRWDGAKIVPLTDDYKQSQKAAGRKQAAERDNFLIEQENRRSVAGNRRSTAVGGSDKRIGPVTGVDDRGNRLGPGAAQPIPPQDTGTPYGEWIGIEPADRRIQNFQDSDGDGVDDRYQSGPGAPSQRRLPAGGGGSSGGSRYSPEDIAYIQAQQRMLQEGRGGVAGYRR